MLNLRNRTARRNMSTGPITQFCTSDSPSIFVFLNTSGNSSYFTFASGGYIITIRPTAMGIFVVPLEREFQKSAIPGLLQPINTPATIARNIHSVRYLSSNLSRFGDGIGLVFYF